MNQTKIWDYFQTEGIESFAGSIPRLNFLVIQAKKALKQSVIEEARVLNIGVGNGWLESKCVQQGWKTYALDISEAAIERIEEAGAKGKVGYIEAIPYEDSFFDVIFCSEVLEHLSDKQLHLGLKEINRVLVKGGFLIGTVPFKENLIANQVVCPDCGKRFHMWGHIQSFDVAKLNLIINKYFKINKMHHIYFFSWNKLNWKGKIGAIFKKILSLFGVPCSNENLFLLAQKCN